MRLNAEMSFEDKTHNLILNRKILIPHLNGVFLWKQSYSFQCVLELRMFLERSHCSSVVKREKGFPGSLTSPGKVLSTEKPV